MPGQDAAAGQIYFAHVESRVVPPAMSSLRDEIELAVLALQELFPDKGSQFASYFNELLVLGQMGLVCTKANPTAALAALETFKKKVVRTEGKRIKSRHLNRLLIVVAIFGVIFWIAGLIANHFVPAPPTAAKIRPGNYFYMLAAAMPAMWLSFAARKQRFSFDDLTQPEDDQMGPFHRVGYVVGFTLILALLGYVRMAGVFLGNFSTQDLGQSISCALVFGVVCGMSEMLLATTVAPHVGKIITGLSQTSAGKIQGGGG